MTIWLIRISLLIFYLSLQARIWGKKHSKHQIMARWLWTIATVTYLFHVGFAFHEYHDWNHEEAVEHTADQSEQTVGLRFGIGIWFNHLFSLLVLSETIWWWVSPSNYEQRKRWFDYLIFGYLGFIAINGAIVFTPSPTNWISLILLLSLAACWIMQRSRNSIRTKIPENK